MKKATATSHGNIRFTAAAGGAEEVAEFIEVILRDESLHGVADKASRRMACQWPNLNT
jgi:hypothetical protein